MVADEHFVEPSADEIYSGPTHELVPSSYSSFHRNHWPHASDEADEGRPRRSRRSSSVSNASRGTGFSRTGSFSSQDSFGGSISSAEDESRFHFFTRDEILAAEGGSTVFGDDDSVNETERLSVADEQASFVSGSEGHAVYNGRREQQRYYIAEEDMRIVCAGYNVHKFRLLIFNLACVLSLGLVYLLGRWFPRQRLKWTSEPSPLGSCAFVIVENQWGEVEKVDVRAESYGHALSTVFNLQDETPNTTSSYVDVDPSVPVLRIFEYRYIRFLYNPAKDMFFTNVDWVNPHWRYLDEAGVGLDGDQVYLRTLAFGRNSLEFAQPSVPALLVREVLHPFYVFQIFSIVLWLLDEYVYYAAAIFVISVFSIYEALKETRTGLQRLAGVAHAASGTEITVLRSKFLNNVHSEDLVPGDVFELSDPSLSMIPADCVLLSGDCIVNESILTGESVPVSKIPADEQALAVLVAEGANSPKLSRQFLYAGTKIIRVRKPPAEKDDFQPALALVVRTGFSTTKGALVRSMMFPKPSKFRFYADSFRYIGVMAGIAMFGFAFSAIRFVQLGLAPSLIVLRALDMITVVVPPALPATLTIGTNFSLQRLVKRNIFCITPSRVNVAGRVNLVAFDKTGTLTDEGLDVLGVHLSKDGTLGSLLTSVRQLENECVHLGLLDTLVACHELRSVDDEVIGDPLDVKMFEFTGYDLNEDRRRFRKGSRELQVFKQFEFVPALRRMSVVASTTDSSSSSRVLAKGAPEIMRQICVPDSLPSNFDELLHLYTHRGYRVIACAFRDVVDVNDYDRTEMESQLTFAGLIVFENKLKPQTQPVIKTLNNAGLRTLMCTGDNVLTAVSVGRECGMISPNVTIIVGYLNESNELRFEGVDNPLLKLDPYTLYPLSPVREDYALAVTGDVFSHIVENGSKEMLEEMLLRGLIYARMSPDEKHELVTNLKMLEYTVCFCGDGANDCGALKESDVGISLSEAEASVAAPFTSKRFDISCVIDVLCEGRCALNTSFSCFKYMSMYSAIQFVSVSILYSLGTNIGDFQFLYIDLFLIVPIAAFMAWSGPPPMLSHKRPTAELVSRQVLVPLVSFMIIVALGQFYAWSLCKYVPYYIAPVSGDNSNLKSTDNTVLFFVSSFQYIGMGYVLCEGLPFRMPVFSNKPFMTTEILSTLITLIFMSTNSESGFADFMDLTYISRSFKLEIIAISVVNFAVMLLANKYLFGPLCEMVRSLKKRILNAREDEPRYKLLAKREAA